MRPLYALLLGLLLSSPAIADDTFSASRYRGKVVYIDFWASWCVPCRKSFPWLNALAAKYPDDLAVVGINVDHDPQAAAHFLERYPAAFPLVYDPDGRIAAQYALEGMPSAVVLDREGHIVHRHIGFREEKIPEYEAVLRGLIADKLAAAGGAR